SKCESPTCCWARRLFSTRRILIVSTSKSKRSRLGHMGQPRGARETRGGYLYCLSPRSPRSPWLVVVPISIDLILVLLPVQNAMLLVESLPHSTTPLPIALLESNKSRKELKMRREMNEKIRSEIHPPVYSAGGDDLAARRRRANTRADSTPRRGHPAQTDAC